MNTDTKLTSSYRSLVEDGLWHNNPGLVQLLGLCPLLAISNSLINGLSLGVATLVTLMVSSTLVSSIRHWIAPEIRIPIYVLIIASAVTAIELGMRAWLPDLYLILGIFIPLIVTNCMIIGRAESFASRNSIKRVAVDAAAQGCGFLWVLTLLGAVRELVGHGTLLRDAHLLFGPAAHNWSVSISADYPGMMIALLPPGAFIALGLLLAIGNITNTAIAKKSQQREAERIEPDRHKPEPS